MRRAGSGFDSINFDLIYGLPQQTAGVVRATRSTRSSTMRPDRVAAYSYAHVPWIRAQPEARSIRWTCRSAERKLAAVRRRPSSDSSAAGLRADRHGPLRAAATTISPRPPRERRLHRNFMGYTTRPATDMVGLGVSAIGDVAGAFAQNHEEARDATTPALDAGRLPGRARLRCSTPTIALRRVRHHRADVQLPRRSGRRRATRFGIDVRRLLRRGAATSSAADGPMADGLRRDVAGGGFAVTPRGRLFVRNICMVFDRYLRRAPRDAGLLPDDLSAPSSRRRSRTPRPSCCSTSAVPATSPSVEPFLVNLFSDRDIIELPLGAAAAAGRRAHHREAARPVGPRATTRASAAARRSCG